MARNFNFRLTLTAISVFLLALAAGWLSQAFAADLLLSWLDNSNNETGFLIERKTGTNGTFAQIAAVGANITAYTDTGLTAGTAYCYRVRAYNSAGSSSYTPAGCATVSAAAPTFNFSLTHGGNKSVTQGQSASNVIKATLISGSPQSVSLLSTSGLPGGATASFLTPNACSPTCSRTLNISTSSLTPVGTYTITVSAMGGGGTRTTSFALTVNPVTEGSTYTLSVNVVKTFTNGGSGNGSVTSSPAGINCGNDCSEPYSRSTVVKLTATPAAGSVFAGWSGHADCKDGAVTMNAVIACTATFTRQTFGLNLIKSGIGTGTVTSSPTGINCGSDCSESFASGISVTLTAAAAAGSVFKNWEGGGCGVANSCTVVLAGSTSITANFILQTAINQLAASKIGVYRPSTGEFFLDRNGNGQWEGCSVDICVKWIAHPAGVPVAGDWDGTGTTRIGHFNTATAVWYLDRNGNGQWEGCNTDICITTFGTPGDFPVVRHQSDSPKSALGVYRSKVISNNKIIDRGVWKLDQNSNGVFDGCAIDVCVSQFGDPDDSAVIGDWNGNGLDPLGIMRANGGSWIIDHNGNNKWEGCLIDKCLSTFGAMYDLPVAGDWDGAGKARIGVFRPSTGQWFLDKNGNGKLDGCAVDSCSGPFGLPGDRPVVGKW